MERGDHTAALAMVDEGLRRNPGDIPLMRMRGYLLVTLDRLDDAESHYRAMAGNQPDSPEPGNDLAIVYRNQGRLYDALLELEAVLKAHPGFAQAYENLVIICARAEGRARVSPEAADFCRDFDHEAAKQRIQDIRDAEPRTVDRDGALEVLALKPAEVSSTPLDETEDDPPDTGRLEREIEDLAREYDQYRRRMEASLKEASAARDAARAETAALQEANAELDRALAAMEERAQDAERRLETVTEKKPDSIDPTNQ